jgi:hypothetical protein
LGAAINLGHHDYRQDAAGDTSVADAVETNAAFSSVVGFARAALKIRCYANDCLATS